MKPQTKQPPRILAYRIARVLTSQELASVGGGACDGFFKVVCVAAKALKATSFSGPSGEADDCQEPAG